MASNIRDLSPSRNPFLDPPSFDEESDSDTEDRTAAAVLVSLRSQHGSSAINSVSASASSSLSRRSPSLSQSSLSTSSQSNLQATSTSMSSAVSATSLEPASDLSVPASSQSNSSTLSSSLASSLEGLEGVEDVDSAVDYLIQSRKRDSTGTFRVPTKTYPLVRRALEQKGIFITIDRLRYRMEKKLQLNNLSQLFLSTNSPSSLQATSTSTISAVSATSLQSASDLSIEDPMELSQSNSSTPSSSLASSLEGLEGVEDVDSAVDYLIQSRKPDSKGTFRVPTKTYPLVRQALKQKGIFRSDNTLRNYMVRRLQENSSVTSSALSSTSSRSRSPSLSQSSLSTSLQSNLQATSTNSVVSATSLQSTSDLSIEDPMELSSSSSLASSSKGLEGITNFVSAVDFLVRSRKQNSKGALIVPDEVYKSVQEDLKQKGIYSTKRILQHHVKQKSSSVTSSVSTSDSSSPRRVSPSLSQSSFSTSLQSNLQATSTSSVVSATGLQSASDLSIEDPMELSQSNSSTPSSSLANSLEGIKDVDSAVDFLIQSRKRDSQGRLRVPKGFYQLVQEELAKKGFDIDKNYLMKEVQFKSLRLKISSVSGTTGSSDVGYYAIALPVTSSSSVSPTQPVQALDLSMASSSSSNAIEPVRKKHKS